MHRVWLELEIAAVSNEGSAANAGFGPSVFPDRRPGTADFVR
jgi:hypothetical protein